MLRATVVYTSAAALMGFYAGRVCPYMDGLGLLGACAFFAACFGAGLGLRWLVTRRWLQRTAFARRARVSFYCDTVVFAGMAAAVAIAEWALFDFPLSSGVKMTMGMTTLWLFVSLDLALAAERHALHAAAERGEVLAGEVPRGDSSLGRHLLMFAAIAMTLAFVDVVLVLNYALGWLSEQGPVVTAEARRAVLAEVFFVGLVVLGLVVVVIAGYARNISILLGYEMLALDAAQRGNFEQQVPVLTRDEFGIIAASTNRMMRELRRNQQARSLLGKMVGGQVAESMLAQVHTDHEVALGGTRRRLVILIADIRGFTPRCESHPPEEVVSDLNCYFSHVVPIVESQGGIVDKFIGDGLMAIFGLNDADDAVDRAVACAQLMQSTLPDIADRVQAPIRIGVGIASGDVVIGNIGSQQRLEFTAIGPAVNLAARLEALTKKLGVDIAIDDRIIDQLSDKRGWRSCGHHDIKGKSAMLEVYGWSSGGRYRAPSTVEHLRV